MPAPAPVPAPAHVPAPVAVPVPVVLVPVLVPAPVPEHCPTLSSPIIARFCQSHHCNQPTASCLDTGTDFFSVTDHPFTAARFPRLQLGTRSDVLLLFDDFNFATFGTTRADACLACAGQPHNFGGLLHADGTFRQIAPCNALEIPRRDFVFTHGAFLLESKHWRGRWRVFAPLPTAVQRI